MTLEEVNQHHDNYPIGMRRSVDDTRLHVPVWKYNSRTGVDARHPNWAILYQAPCTRVCPSLQFGSLSNRAIACYPAL